MAFGEGGGGLDGFGAEGVGDTGALEGLEVAVAAAHAAQGIIQKAFISFFMSFSFLFLSQTRKLTTLPR